MSPNVTCRSYQGEKDQGKKKKNHFFFHLCLDASLLWASPGWLGWHPQPAWSCGSPRRTNVAEVAGSWSSELSAKSPLGGKSSFPAAPASAAIKLSLRRLPPLCSEEEAEASYWLGKRPDKGFIWDVSVWEKKLKHVSVWTSRSGLQGLPAWIPSQLVLLSALPCYHVPWVTISSSHWRTRKQPLISPNLSRHTSIEGTFHRFGDFCGTGCCSAAPWGYSTCAESWVVSGDWYAPKGL